MIFRRKAVGLAVIGAILFSLTASATLAEVLPDRSDHYKLLPRYSVMGRTGGFTGEAVRLRLKGDYLFDQSYEFGPFGSYVQRGDFARAEVWGSRISPGRSAAITERVLDVDELLNLTDLPGHLIPSMGPFDVYLFEGQLDDGSDVELYTALFGPWMFLYGETEAPVGSADFFEYKVRALARTRPWADANDDGVVDGADYTILRDSLDGVVGAATGGNIDGLTLDDWREQFGERLPDMAGMELMFESAVAASQATSVPEPGTLCLVAAGLLCTVRRRR